MPNSDVFLRPEPYALAGLAMLFSGFILSEDLEKWHWRAYLWMVIFVDFFFAAFGPWGHIFGVFGVGIAPIVYFGTFQKRQFSLRDMLLFVLVLASMCTQIASGVNY